MALSFGPACRVARAAFELDPTCPRSAGMGGAGVALAGDAWAATRNPALARATAAAAGVAWSQLFGLPELGRESVNVISESHRQPWAISATTFGSDLYRESHLGALLARQVAPTLAAGVEVSGNWVEIRNFDQGRALGFTAGLLTRPVRPLSIAAVWRNFNSPRLTAFRERLPESLVIGMALQIGDEGVLAADILQEKRFRAEYRLGAEARVMRALWIRVGARAEPVRPSAGLEIAVRRWHFLYAGDLHPDLGASHELGLSVDLH